MRAGELRDFVTIEKPSGAQNAAGQLVNWTEHASVYAKVEPLRGRELQNARTLQSPVTTKVTVRYLAGVTPNMRVVLGSRKFKIDAVVDPENRHRELELNCVEVQ